MSRILFAAARGARIQSRWTDETPQWHTVRKIYLVEDLPYQRIHPDDEHLQYGPISTLLREMALTGDCDGADIPYIRITLLTEEGYWKSTEDQQCVFCLILAEALADEGM
jgi:hypothetical protein